MTLTMDLTPEVHAALEAQAAAQGLDVPAYAATLLVQAAQPARSKRPEQLGPRQRPAGRKGLARLFAESPFKGLDMDFERDRT